MIFLDFDGVLYDTVREAYVVAVITSEKYNSIYEIDFETEHYQNFRKLRHLISPAWNYKYLLEELEINQKFSKIRNNFLENISKAKKEDYTIFENKFFDTRSYLSKHHYEKWLRLNVPFPFLSKIKFLISQNMNFVYIITTKDKFTILKLLSLEGISFDSERIFDKVDYEKFGNKKAIIKNLMNDNLESLFIDDSYKHILDCSEIKGLKCIQPNWGYIGLDDETVSQSTVLNEINNLLSRKRNV